METISIKTGILKSQPFKKLFKIIKREIKNKDILVITSKIVALEQGRMVKLKTVRISKKARKLARKFSLRPAIT